MSTSSHRLFVNVIIGDAERVLLLCVDEGGQLKWRLPQAIAEGGESLRSAAARGVAEEVGLNLRIGELAFVAEVMSHSEGPQLHFGFVGRAPAGEPPGRSSDGAGPLTGISDIALVSADKLRAYVTARTLLIPLETWFQERSMRYHVFDLDRIAAETESV